MSWIRTRLAEPSTHAAITAVLAAAAPFLPKPWGYVAVAIFGALGFAIPERKS